MTWIPALTPHLLIVVLLTAALPSSLLADRLVDIVLAAGSGTGFASSSQLGCSRDHVEGCDLYRVAYLTSTGAAAVKKITDTSSSKGVIFPSVNPDRTHVAYEVRDPSVPKGTLRIISILGGDSTKLSDRGRFPHFYRNDRIVYSTDNKDRGNSIIKASLRDRGDPLDAGDWTQKVLLSPEGSKTSYSDPFVNPVNTNQFLYTFKLRKQDDSEFIDTYVWDLAAKRKYQLNGASTSNLAHAVFNTDGTEIASGSRDHVPFGFKMVSGHWYNEDQGPLYRRARGSTLVELMGGSHTDEKGRKVCDDEDTQYAILHSYVGYCDHNDWITLSLQCARLDTLDSVDDTKNLKETEYSRVFLVDIEDRDNPVYYDLIKPIEEFLNEDPYSMQGVTAACVPGP